MTTKLCLTGDIALSGIVSSLGESDIKERVNLSRTAGQGSYLINLEAPVVSEGMVSQKARGVVLHCSPGSLTAFLANNSIAAVTLANNHSLDYGYTGVQETIRILDSFKIPHTGAGYLKEHLAPVSFTAGGISYVLLAYVHADTNPYLEEGLFLNLYDRNRIMKEIATVKASADRVIVSLHWGSDYSSYPRQWQIEDAHAFIDSGADVIAGHHPHVAQPFERYHGRYIFYSLGSTLFGDFYLRGRLRALPLKTKRSFVPSFTDLHSYADFFGTRELKGNFLTAEHRDVGRWSERMMRRTRFRNSCRMAEYILNFKEKHLDRWYDVLCGYYRSPFKDIFSASAIRNAMNIIRKKD